MLKTEDLRGTRFLFPGRGVSFRKIGCRERAGRMACGSGIEAEGGDPWRSFGITLDDECPKQGWIWSILGRLPVWTPGFSRRRPRIDASCDTLRCLKVWRLHESCLRRSRPTTGCAGKDSSIQPRLNKDRCTASMKE